MFGERFTRVFGEHIVAAGDADQFRYPANAGELPLQKMYPKTSDRYTRPSQTEA